VKHGHPREKEKAVKNWRRGQRRAGEAATPGEAVGNTDYRNEVEKKSRGPSQGSERRGKEKEEHPDEESPPADAGKITEKGGRARKRRNFVRDRPFKSVGKITWFTVSPQEEKEKQFREGGE